MTFKDIETINNYFAHTSQVYYLKTTNIVTQAINRANWPISSLGYKDFRFLDGLINVIDWSLIVCLGVDMHGKISSFS